MKTDRPGHPSTQSSLCAQWVAKDLSFLHADSEDWVDAQADLSLHWAPMPFCWLCHEVAQLSCKRALRGTDMYTFRVATLSEFFLLPF